MERTATSYLNKLAQLLLLTEVTDRKGARPSLDEGANTAVELILKALAEKAKVMVTGNGGSAAIALHFHNDLENTVGVRSKVFYAPSQLTALANDFGYGSIFEYPIRMWAEKGDILVAISSSGRSENILRAAKAALEKGCRIITLTGFKPDNPLRRLGDLNFYIASESYGYVESAHGVLVHHFADMAVARKAEAGR